ncbi:hypothetical protein LCGC14_0976610 [marine sediment metagenome]|uniref:Uncharacterized protein n=1 Tax=marine sediment metagenome TaxID=412755 RepID=A0A0F9QTE3_9ZZZZ
MGTAIEDKVGYLIGTSPITILWLPACWCWKKPLDTGSTIWCPLHGYVKHSHQNTLRRLKWIDLAMKKPSLDLMER